MANRNLNILVAGGYDPADPKQLDKAVDQIEKFARCLGIQIIAQGHNLWNGCQTELDKIVAESADKYLKSQSEKSEASVPRIVSYVLRGKQPIHQYGEIMESARDDWDIGGLQPTPPELIQYVDVVILLGGFYGTLKAANWARIARKPLLPMSSFGGTSKEVYEVESSRFNQIYASNIDHLEYEKVLKSLSTNWEDLAEKTIALAEKIVTTPSVFVIMSFSESDEYTDLYESIKEVCEEYDYVARRVDESNLLKRIIPEITKQVRQSAFVIADVTEPKANVYYELGFADGVGKEVILTAKAGTKLPFDINDVPVLFWGSFTVFKKELKKRIERIGAWQGRV